MSRNSNGPEVVETPRVRESNSVAARPIVPQPPPETEPAVVIADYWQAAKARYQRGDYVDYGSDDWKALPLEDPRKMAGLVAFAQMWLRYGDEIADNLHQTLRAPHELVHRATTEACATAIRQIHAKQAHNRKEAA